MSNHKSIPFQKSKIEKIIKEYPTPFHLYIEDVIREKAQEVKNTFSWSKDYKEYFAVKSNPNPHILKIMKSEGFGTDCSSFPELIISKKVGIVGEDIMFTSNNTPKEEFIEASRLGAIINLDDISHIEFLQKHVGVPQVISLRYNPGDAKKGNNIIGEPIKSKFGFTKKQIIEGYRRLSELGVKRFGLHTMVVSNELTPESFVETANMLFELVLEVHNIHNIKIEFVNMGGGLGIPYHPSEEAVNLEDVGNGIRKSYEDIIVKNKLDPIKICSEYGRFLTAECGYLITTAVHKKHTYREYIGVDANMANLMRPGMYKKAYHHISVLGKENEKKEKVYDIVGSLCENNDKFAKKRKLPNIDIGDILAIHDTGAHGHAMGFNYNGKLRSAELLLKSDGTVKMIRRAETIEDYFATIDFDSLK